MYLVLFVLDDVDHLEDLLDAWESVGVTGATIFPSTGLGRIRQFDGYRDDLPLMPGLDDLYQMRGEFHRTLFTVVKDDQMVDELVAATQRVIGDLEQPDTGFLVVLPVVKTYGLMKRKKKPD